MLSPSRISCGTPARRTSASLRASALFSVTVGETDASLPSGLHRDVDALSVAVNDAICLFNVDNSSIIMDIVLAPIRTRRLFRL